MTLHHIRPNCGHCMYWTEDHTAATPTVGHCHRYPPGVYINPQTGTVVQKFPSVDRHHWCGEWSDDDVLLVAAAKRTAIEEAMRTGA